jgi:hypothetical protein
LHHDRPKIHCRDTKDIYVFWLHYNNSSININFNNNLEMSWKPCRGGRVLLDRYVNDSIEYYHKFHETNVLKDKSKYAFKMLRAAVYFNDHERTIKFFGAKFIEQCKQHPKETYKPFLNLINKIHEKTI